MALWPLNCNHMGRDVSGAPDLSMTYYALALTAPVITCSEDTRQQFNISGSANFAENWPENPVFLEVRVLTAVGNWLPYCKKIACKNYAHTI